MAFTDLLNELGVSPDGVLNDEQQTMANEAATNKVETVAPSPPAQPEQFPNNPVLAGAQTPKGGLFANVGGGNLAAIEGKKLSEFPTGSHSKLNGQFMQPVYVNTTEESASIEIVSEGFGASSQNLGVEAYNETEFGTDDQWYRIPTGTGTPYPIGEDGNTAWDEDGNFVGGPLDHDYRLKGVSETEDGFKVVWEQLEEV